MGNPVAFYLFQGARISSLAPWLSLHYEWNFGLSAGWKTYDPYYNSSNTIIGSKVNAYINVNFSRIFILALKFYKFFSIMISIRVSQ